LATATRPGEAGRDAKSSTLDRFFGVTKAGSTVPTEIRAGLATFLTMCYILFVNPSILSSVKDHAGHSLAFNQVLTVTALVAGVMTLLMGLYGKKPFALAAGLGLNAFVAFSLVGGTAQLSWPDAMGVIVVEGLVIFVLVLTNVRELVLDAIPHDLKLAIGVGIGFFLTLIGLVNAGVVVKGSGTLVAMAPHYRGWPLVIFAVGLLLTAAFVARQMKGALLYGIVSTTAIATVINALNHNSVFTDGSARVPKSWIWPDFGLVGAFSFNFWDVLGTGSAVAVVMSVMLSDFFDTAGTVMGISAKAGMLNSFGKLPGMKRVLMVDSLAAAAGGAASASSNTTFIESAAGVHEGGRTGLTAVVVGLLFLASLVLAPIAGMVPAVATAPVLVIVGWYMIRLARDIEWDNITIGLPALLAVATMPFTYSITNGVGVMSVSYVALSVLSGKARSVKPLMYVVAAVLSLIKGKRRGCDMRTPADLVFPGFLSVKTDGLR
jgi:AGZA family xanthine/uracil permease-like MFS transporter